MKSNAALHDRPVAATEHRHRKRVGAHQQLISLGRVLPAGTAGQSCSGIRLVATCRDDAPNQPDRESDMLGQDGPDQIASGDGLPFASSAISHLPDLPICNPGSVSLLITGVLFVSSELSIGSGSPSAQARQRAGRFAVPPGGRRSSSGQATPISRRPRDRCRCDDAIRDDLDVDGRGLAPSHHLSQEPSWHGCATGS